MGSATEKFLTDRASVNQMVKQQRREDRARRRADARRDRADDARAWSKLQIEIPQLAELISANESWQRSRRAKGYIYTLEEYERNQGGERCTLVLRMKRTAFGKIKLSVGLFRTWPTNTFEPLSMKRYATRILAATLTHKAQLKS